MEKNKPKETWCAQHVANSHCGAMLHRETRFFLETVTCSSHFCMGCST